MTTNIMTSWVSTVSEKKMNKDLELVLNELCYNKLYMRLLGR